MTTTIATIKKPFNNIIGQESVKRKLNFYIDGFKQTSMIPHFMFIAERGCGKTIFATSVAKQLSIDGTTKPATEINCSTIKNLKQFCEQILLTKVHGCDCTLLFDEASELPRDVTMALLTMLNPNSNNGNTFVYGDYTFNIDFKRHSFMFATTEPQRIFHALMSRCARIDFEPYSHGDLMEIVELNVGKNSKIKFSDDGVVDEIPTVLRSNPREAQKMATDIVTYCAKSNTKVFTKSDWKSLLNSLGIYPMGLNATEIKVLKVLFNSGNIGIRLCDISAQTGFTSSSIQRDVETHLLRSNLICIQSGRKLTKKGKEYLESVLV